MSGKKEKRIAVPRKLPPRARQLPVLDWRAKRAPFDEVSPARVGPRGPRKAESRDKGDSRRFDVVH